MNRPFQRRESIIFFAFALLLVVILPLASSIGWISPFKLNTWGKYLSYAILAIAVDLLWGYTGLLSLGQALFFSLGGYMMGMYLMLMIGKLGQYKSNLPDFLVFLGHSELPAIWKPFYSFPFALLMVVLIPGILAFIFGYLAFRSRIKGVYFSILTQALTYGAALMFFRNDLNMGGNNGFTDFRFILGADIRSDGTKRTLFIVTAIVLLGVYAGCRWLTTTKFGLIQRAVRDSENRVLFSGYAAANYKLFVFVLCAIIASIGGSLFVTQVGIINPSEMTTQKSLEAVVWVAVGGRGTLIGPVLGAIGVNSLQSWATRAMPDYWLLFLGAGFTLAVLFMPKGLVGLPLQLRNAFVKYKSRSTAEQDATPIPAAAVTIKPTPSPSSSPSAE
ncbi:urea ABC transporter permease subunit UrtC [Verrucomicrobium sp. BvORR034]|uniref:urea ABC transporter permease subunit UrtC n=1 Tax=Verrucomicrobium sp. BvORR034 TaxID=1396418 RepID=UPI000679BA62|nr:urea ABC transporter permease subunit UrtC [Verrucomicrobium sp. BvORR034]